MTESIEMYLESILVIKERKGNVRAIDIAHELNYSKPTISQQMKRLKEKELITISDNGNIDLTEEGLSIAKMILERHNVLSKILEFIGVDSEIAAEDACRVEHYISPETFDALKNYFDPLIKNDAK